MTQIHITVTDIDAETTVGSEDVPVAGALEEVVWRHLRENWGVDFDSVDVATTPD